MDSNLNTPANKIPSFEYLKKKVQDKEINADNFFEFADAKVAGDLDENNIKIFDEFLLNHPELQKEVRQFDLCQAPLDNTQQYPDKQALYKSLSDVETPMTHEQIEEYIIAYLENDLSQKELILFDSLRKENGTIKTLIDLYQSTYLTPDYSITYSGKGKLKKPVAFFALHKNVIAKTLAAAASIALIAGLFFLYPKNDFSSYQPRKSSSPLLIADNNHSQPANAKPAINQEGHLTEIEIAAADKKMFFSPLETNRGIDNRIHDEAAINYEKLSSKGNMEISFHNILPVAITETTPLPAIPYSNKNSKINQHPILAQSIERIKYYTGGGNESPKFIEELSFISIAESTNAHQHLNVAGQYLFIKWEEWKNNSINFLGIDR